MHNLSSFTKYQYEGIDTKRLRKDQKGSDLSGGKMSRTRYSIARGDSAFRSTQKLWEHSTSTPNQLFRATMKPLFSISRQAAYTLAKSFGLNEMRGHLMIIW
jgi:hypothetical protein